MSENSSKMARLFSKLLATAVLIGAIGCRENANQNQAKSKNSNPPAAATAKKAARPLAEEPADVPLNVILLAIDALRADMPWTGYPRDIAPWLTRFAAASVTYTRAYSLSSMTARSVGGLLTGRYPSELWRNGEFFSTYYEENVFFPETLQAAGHRTLAVFSHAYFVPATGITQGFDDARILPGTYMKNMRRDNITSQRITELAQQMLRETASRLQPEKRFFAYLHFMDPHAPYLVHAGRPSFGSLPRDRYDQEVHFTDEWVGKLVDWVKQQPFGSKTAFIITADHGEAFGEHGLNKHAYELWEELIHVPLLIQVPQSQPQRIEVPRSHIDLAPTILELMGTKPLPGLQGKSLLPELRGAPPQRRPVLADLPPDNLQDRRRALIIDDHKLIAFGDDARFALFDLEADPGEKRDLVSSRPELFEQLKNRYDTINRSIEQQPARAHAAPKKAAGSHR